MFKYLQNLQFSLALTCNMAPHGHVLLTYFIALTFSSIKQRNVSWQWAPNTIFCFCNLKKIIRSEFLFHSFLHSELLSQFLFIPIYIKLRNWQAIIKSSDGTMEVQLPAFVGNYNGQLNQSTNGQTGSQGIYTSTDDLLYCKQSLSKQLLASSYRWTAGDQVPHLKQKNCGQEL